MTTDTTPIPSGYAATLADLKRQVRNARFSAQRRVNTELVRFYWGIGATILQRQDAEGWGSNVIGRLATDLRAEFPDMKGFSRANLFYMRRFAGEWSAEAVVQQAVGQLLWGHITVLLDRLDDHDLRDWYAEQAATHGWSRNVLEHQIRTTAHTRLRAAPTNFPATLPARESDLAQQLTKDPYVLDFLVLDGDAKERHLEQALVDRIIETLRELGEGFAFVGRQVQFDVSGDDFYLDLLFFHVVQLRYVVIEAEDREVQARVTRPARLLRRTRRRQASPCSARGHRRVAPRRGQERRGRAVFPRWAADWRRELRPLAPAVQAALPTEAELAQVLRDSTDDPHTSFGGAEQDE